MVNTRSLPQGVSIITVTNRPQFFKHIIRNYTSQRYRTKELIIVLNKSSMDLTEYRKKVRGYKNISVYKMADQVSLGRCLNLAVSKTKYPLIAKFDDDDYYSPYYLTEQTKALARSGASIVGKRAHMIFVEARRLLVMRFPDKKSRFVGLVSGGTILFKRLVFNQVRFTNTSLGEDVSFLRRSLRKGFKIYATSPYNFVGIRRKNKQSHTWKADDQYILHGSLVLAKTDRYKKYALRPVK